MKGILKDLAVKADVKIEEMEVMPEHVHLLLSFKPKYAPTDIVKAFKGHRAKQFFSRHPEIRNSKLW